MKITQLLSALESYLDSHGNLDVHFVNDQFEASPIEVVALSYFVDGSLITDGLTVVNEEDLGEYDDYFLGIELQ